MMIRNARTRVGIACFFLALLIIQGLIPSVAWALTSGPAQPETKKFMQAGTSDMVDLSTGDFKYNIPLLDVDGYPVNLNYQSGVGMDDEASWVGLGWNLNAGAINRQIRGIADDSDGDEVVSENDMKQKVTVGGSIKARGELFGSGLGGSVSIGIFSDNYTGIGAEVGLNIAQKLTDDNGSSMTLGLGLNSNTSDGTTISPSFAGSAKGMMNDYRGGGGGLSINANYNSREGLKNLTLGATYSGLDLTSNFSFNTPTFYPHAAMTFKSANTTFKADVGPGAFGAYLGYGLTGYMSKRTVINASQKNRAYGFMYAQNGKSRDNVLTDFMREKDAALIPKIQMLPLPVATPDIFSYSSQTGSGQFKAVSNSTGAFFDSRTSDYSDNTSISYEYGYGGIFHTGISVYLADITSSNGRWRRDNNFLAKGDFPKTESLNEEQVYFKQTGEKGIEDPIFAGRIQGEEAVRVPLNGKTAKPQLQADGKPAVQLDDQEYYKKNGRQPRQSPISYLTAEQAMTAGLDKKIISYDVNEASSFSPPPCAGGGRVTFEFRANTTYRKPKHISEITVNEADGKRMVYGIPVYNKGQVEYTYSVDGTTASAEQKRNGLIPIKKVGDNIDYKSGGAESTDQYFHKEEQPGYATSYLLTGILSPDYVDVGNDGITDDDRGTAIKFKYSKIKDESNPDFNTADSYKWRTPAQQGMAQFNPGLRADPADDKASFIYGEKEVWYMHSIESKTKIAYFLTEERNDAMGLDAMGNKDPKLKQRLLREIRLYSKSDLSKPIKTVKMEYNYDLCKGVYNQVDDEKKSGKLTLTKVYFTYGTSTKGASHKYEFKYSAVNPVYAEMSSDRWGTYKAQYDNGSDKWGADFGNDLFPYALQDIFKSKANAETWQLSTIFLPTGGAISVDYEPDDYAYVQDKRATTMLHFKGMYKADGTEVTSLLEAERFDIELPATEDGNQADEKPLGFEDFKERFLGGTPYMYVKMFTCMSDDVNSEDEKFYDFVPCYVKVNGMTSNVDNPRIVRVSLEDEVNDGVPVNPIANAAWQRMRIDYPIYAYPGYKNRIGPDKPIAAAVSALGNSIKNLAEILENFNKRANRNKFASKVKLDKSFARVVKINGHKRGGGARVKRIYLSDEWQTMTGGEATAQYGQEYDYNITEDEQTISSGVASYEPSLGGDENPMRQPVIYEQHAGVGLNNVFYHEEPAGESFFPSPSVVYRQVKVRNLSEIGVADPNNKTGWLSYEFYTAKEFPVMVDRTDLEKNKHQPFPWLLFFGGRSVSELAMSQGYSIVVNDMHGKPKAERIFNQSGQEISSTEYQYAATQEGTHMRLNNKVDVVDAAGVITNDQVIGREIELFADMRESETRNIGKDINPGIDFFQLGLFSIPLLHGPVVKNEDYRLFRSSCLTKLVQYYGVVKSVIKKVNGAATTASNVLFDKSTGDPVLVQGENEFRDPVYTLTIPAYWIYNKMGLSYQNLGMILKDFSVDDSGVPGAAFRDYLTAGDELINLSNGVSTRLWVVYTALDGVGTKTLHVIDEAGRLVRSLKGNIIVRRSGYRNQLGAPATAITSLTNPVVENKLKFISGVDLSNDKIINATAVLYDEAWGQAAACKPQNCPDGYTKGVDGNCYALPDATYAADFKIVPGDNRPEYGQDGGYFFSEDRVVTDFVSTGSYWKGRLNEVGIWLKDLPDNQWWGMEKCFNLDLPAAIQIGQAVDDEMRLFIDGVEVQFVGFDQGNFRRWSVRKRTEMLSSGKHTIRVLAKSNVDAEGHQTPKSVGFEIYKESLGNLWDKPDDIIRSSRVLTSLDINESNTLLFLCDANGVITKQNYKCTNGNLLNTCDGSPNCGVQGPGACPPGYVKSGDGQTCIPVENTDPGLALAKAVKSSAYSSQGAVFYDENGNQLARVKNPFWGTDQCPSGGGGSFAAGRMASSDGSCGRLNPSGVWLNNAYAGKWIGFNSCLKVPVSKTYYMGMGVENQMRVYIDGEKKKELLSDGSDQFTDWKVYPVYLTAGDHIITIEALQKGLTGTYAVGLEVYNNTLEELKNSTSINDVSIIYKTDGLLNGKPKDTYVKNSLGEFEMRRFPCPTASMDICGDNLVCTPILLTPPINPYLTGYLGNWLPYKQMVWLSGRSGQELLTNTTGSTNIRQGGYYKNFKAFWIYDNGWNMSGDNDWVTSVTSTLYDRYSQELETKDALGHYSAARYGFRYTLPVAVGVNARSREIYYDGFDDYKFNNTCGVQPCELDEFSIQQQVGGDYAARLSADDAHSGNYSYKLTNALELKTYLFRNEHTPGIYLNINQLGEYYLNPLGWAGLRGFCPVNDRKYIFSVWVKDNAPGSTDVKIKLTVNNSDVTLLTKAIVEGWKLVEGEMNFSTNAPEGDMPEVPFRLEPTVAGSNILIDDIRMFPYDGQLKTYTYDDQTMRVMAEMDENNYATFYEYDDEGSLVRVKKETERGIMTIKESRSAYRKNPKP